MSRARPRRSVQQIHRFGPFFQHNPRSAFRAPAAKIRVHRKPPGYLTTGGGARTALNETRRLTAPPANSFSPSPLYGFADSVQYSGIPREGRAISYPRNQTDPVGRRTYPQISGCNEIQLVGLNRLGIRATRPGFTGKPVLAEIAQSTRFTDSTRCPASQIGPLLNICQIFASCRTPPTGKSAIAQPAGNNQEEMISNA
jgi:hypothetical protein